MSAVPKTKTQAFIGPVKNTTPVAFSGGNLIGNVKLPAVAPLPSGASTNLLSTPVAKQVASGAFKNVAPVTSFGNNNSSIVGGNALQSNQSFAGVSSPVVATNNVNLGSQSLPSTNVINAPTTLGINNPKITFPDLAKTNYPVVPPVVNPVDQNAIDATKQKDTSMQDYLDTLLNNQPSSADAYNKAQQQSGILQAQQNVTNLSGQINEIVNRGQANQLSLVGQGRGIPEAIIGGQQAQIGRETAIAALPVQAQLSAAQGNLEMAKSNLDTLFKIYSEDATNAYNNKVAVKKAVYEYASEKEKKALDKQTLAETRSYNQTLALQKDAQDYAKMAFDNGQSALGAKISTLAQNVNSPTFQQDFAKLQVQLKDPIKDLEQKIKQKQYDALVGNSGRKIVKVNGIDYYQNANGSLSEIVPPNNELKATSLKAKIDLIDQTINSAGLNSAVGTSGLTRTGAGKIGTALASTAAGAGAGSLAGPIGTLVGGVAGLVGGLYAGSPAEITGERQNFIAGVEQLISKEFLDNLIAVKAQGATFGALQKAEQDALTQAASKIGFWRTTSGTGESRQVTGYNINETEFVTELNKIKSLAQTAYERAGGEVNQDTAASNYVNSVVPTLEGTSNVYSQAGYQLK